MSGSSTARAPLAGNPGRRGFRQFRSGASSRPPDRRPRFRAGASSSPRRPGTEASEFRWPAQRPPRGPEDRPARRRPRGAPSARPISSAPRENSRVIPKRWSGCASPSTQAASIRCRASSGSALPCPTVAGSPARIGLCLATKRHQSSCGMSAATPLIPSATRAEGARPGQTQEASPAPPWRVSAAAGRTRWTAVCGPRPRAGLVPARRIRSPRCK